MVDYSKWKNIEISDDEDETHPNIDTASLFRWRHQARVERMEEHKREIEELEKQKKLQEKKKAEVKTKLYEKANDPEIQDSLKKLELEEQQLKEKEEEIKQKEKVMPWNVDTISNEGFTKTVINKKDSLPDEENLTDEQREENLKKFIKDNEKLLKKFGMLRRYEDSQAFLQENGHLVCENTANYLVIWCINLEMEEKHELMSHVAHQTICMQYILELSKQIKIHPRACVSSFFTRIKIAEPEYKASFDDELRQFKQRIQRRAQEKIKEALAEAEEEERKQRLGPGGLDPVEVFETLPVELQKCFESKDIQLLQETIANMEEEQARYHMKRCVDSGLWLPDANKSKEEESAAGPETEETSDKSKS